MTSWWCDRAGRDRCRVPGAEHRGQGDQRDRHDRRADNARRRRQHDADDQDREDHPGTHPAGQQVDRTQHVVGNTALLQRHPHEQQHRHRRIEQRAAYGVRQLGRDGEKSGHGHLAQANADQAKDRSQPEQHH